MTPADPRHGTEAGYRAGCRIDHCCRAAHRRYDRGLRLDNLRGNPRLVDSTGTIRRIRALRRLGWGLEHIADQAGYDSMQAIERICKRNAVTVGTRNRIARAYDGLSMKLGPSSRARSHAERMGWAPPLAWDDDAIDDPEATPYIPGKKQHPHVGQSAERAATLADLDHWGHGISEACRRLNTSRDALEAWSYRHGHADVYQRLVERENYAEKVNGATAERRAG